MYRLIHTKEEKKFGWMEMGIVVKIHVPIHRHFTTKILPGSGGGAAGDPLRLFQAEIQPRFFVV
jgi:hypothetical protein